LSARFSALTVILVSGYAEEEARKICTSPSISFLQKPYKLTALTEKIQQAVGKTH
jgi:FixJ family two-component response regulator